MFLDRANTLDDLAPGRFFEKLSLGDYSLSAGPLTNGDFDHRRRSGETRIRQVPNTTTDHRFRYTNGRLRKPYALSFPSFLPAVCIRKSAQPLFSSGTNRPCPYPRSVRGAL